jgi:hypothetical protein
LNIIERKRWVRVYLRCYLGCEDNDQCGVLENGPLSHHFTMLEEEFLEISAISFKRLVTLLRLGVDVRLDDVVLVEVGSIGAGVFPLHA